MVKINEGFIGVCKDFPEHMTPIGKFTYLRTYSRYRDDLGRREVWKETVRRASEYNVSLAEEHLTKLGIPVDHKALQSEARLLFRNQFNLKQALSGRTLWVGGAENGVANKFPLANFNCSFTTIEEWEDLAELFYLLLVGTGVGFKSTPKMARNMAPIRDDFEVIFDEYNSLPKGLRSDDTRLLLHQRLVYQEDTKTYVTYMRAGTATIHVGDSKEGWVDAVRKFFMLLTDTEYGHFDTICFNFDSVRPAGERLVTFGGTASGHTPLLEMFEVFEKVIKNNLDTSLEPLERVDETYVKLRPVHIADMANAIGYNVVVGGVRRTAEIFLFSGDPGEVDYESMFMKFGINGVWGEDGFKHLAKVRKLAESIDIPIPKFFKDLEVKLYDVRYHDVVTTFKDIEEAKQYAYELGIEDYFPYPYNPGRPLHHRRMSNNSMAFHTAEKPGKDLLDFIFLMMKGEGEPGFINLYEASRRRLEKMGISNPSLIEEYAEKLGLNPCAEILLYSKGVCNLTTVNVMGFVYYTNGEAKLDVAGLFEAQKLSARAGLRMTLVDLELPNWDKVQKRDRLLGTSLTGWKDAMGALGFDEYREQILLTELHREARDEADRYAKELRIPAPLLTTTVKPEGTLSIVFGAVSSGLHVSHAPNYIRRIRINAQDPLAKTVLAMRGWKVHAEVGTDGYNMPEDLAKYEVISKARTLVIDFPVQSSAKKTKEETYVDEQFNTYFAFQKHYTEHNTSNTIHLRENEWERACNIIYRKWDDFVGVSFLALDGGSYMLAPYEACSEVQYSALWNSMEQFDFDTLKMFDAPQEGDSSLDGMESCDGGICPVR